MNEYYVYCYMDPRKPGNYQYDSIEICFLYEPFYIGKGKKSRIKSHISSYELNNQKRISHNRLKNSKIKSIINDGLTPFYIKIFENLSEQDSNIIESFLISKIGRIINKSGTLLNISDGGDGGDNMKYLDPIRKKEIYTKLGNLFRGQKYKGPDRGKKVYQYDTNGNFIKEFPSLRNASSVLNINRYTIAQSIKGEYKSAGGFIFRDQKFINIEPLEKTTTSVIQYDINGNYIKDWSSMMDASKSLGISISGISLCCSGKYKHSGGFIWKYKI